MFPEVSIYCISFSTPQVSRIIFRWDVMPLDLVVLLDVVHSVCNELMILPWTLDPIVLRLSPASSEFHVVGLKAACMFVMRFTAM